MSNIDKNRMEKEMSLVWYERRLTAGFVHDRPFGISDDACHLFLFLGSAQVGCASGRQKVAAGSAIIYPPGAPQFFRSVENDGGELVCDHVLFSKALAPLVQRLELPMNEVFPLYGLHEIRDLIFRLHREQNSKNLAYQEVMRDLERMLLVFVKRTMQQQDSDQAPDVTQEQREAIQELCSRILLDPKQRWSVRELAQQMGMSRSRFWVSFREVVGDSPQGFIISARLSSACALLTNTKLSIKEVAMRTGFSSAYYLSRIFHQRIGCPPSRYADQFRVRE